MKDIEIRYKYFKNRINVSHNHVYDSKAFCEHSYKRPESLDCRRFLTRIMKDIERCNEESYRDQWAPTLPNYKA